MWVAQFGDYAVCVCALVPRGCGADYICTVRSLFGSSFGSLGVLPAGSPTVVHAWRYLTSNFLHLRLFAHLILGSDGQLHHLGSGI